VLSAIVATDDPSFLALYRFSWCFEFRNGDAFDVEIIDYHKG
jgi:hypothetical protein